MKRPRMLDLFCCQGGAGMGYHRAGFDVIGVDISPQPRYPFGFYQADALRYLAKYGEEFDAIHASPPCQAFTLAQRIQGNEHPDLIEPVRALVKELGLPYVIENVPGAPLHNPLELCGCMFDGLNVYRPRWFESNVQLPLMLHSPHVEAQTKMGRRPVPGQRMHVVGNFSNVAAGAAAMGIDWMTRDGLREAIPPAYTEHIGTALLDALDVAA